MGNQKATEPLQPQFFSDLAQIFDVVVALDPERNLDNGLPSA